MKLNSKYISLIVLSFILVLVAGISFLSIEKSDVEEVYAHFITSGSVPSGYSLVPFATFVDSDDFYIDTSVSNLSGKDIGNAASFSNENIILTNYVITYNVGYGSDTVYHNLALAYKRSTISDLIYWYGLLDSNGVNRYTFMSINSSANIVWTVSDENQNIYLSSDLQWVNASYPNNTLYYLNSVQPVTQSTSITWDSGVSGVTFDGVRYSSSGSSNSITYDNEGDTPYYDLDVVPVSGYSPTYVTVTYLSDTSSDVPTRWEFSGNQVRIGCPLGDAITSISIESELVSWVHPIDISFSNGIKSVTVEDAYGSHYVSSSSSLDLSYSLGDDITFIVFLSPGYTYESYSVEYEGGSFSLDTSTLEQYNYFTLIYSMGSGDYISSLSFLPRFVGYDITYTCFFYDDVTVWGVPINSGDYLDQTRKQVSVHYDNDNSVSSANVLYNQLIDSTSSISEKVYIQQFYVSSVNDLTNEDILSFPYLPSSIYDSVIAVIFYRNTGGATFLDEGSDLGFSPSFIFSDVSSNGSNLGIGAYDFLQDKTLVSFPVAPYLVSDYWYYAYVSGVADVLDDTITVTINIGAFSNSFECEYLSYGLNGVRLINLSSVKDYLTNLSNSNGFLYYPSHLIFTNPSVGDSSLTIDFNTRNSIDIGIEQSFSFLEGIFMGVFNMLSVQIAEGFTLLHIFLAVLGLGILLFVFRISGVF